MPETPESFLAEASEASAATRDLTAARSPARIASKKVLLSGIPTSLHARRQAQAVKIMRPVHRCQQSGIPGPSTCRGGFLWRLVMTRHRAQGYRNPVPGIDRRDGKGQVDDLFVRKLRLHRVERLVGRMRG